MTTNSPRFLITRLSHIGDCLLTLPLAAELRQQFPKAFIAWASEPAGAKLLQHHPAIDEVIVVPKKWCQNPFHVRRWQKKLRGYSFDTAIDPQGLFKSSLLGRISGAKIRIGFSGEHGREGSQWLNNRLVRPTATHLVDRTLELLQKLQLPKVVAPACLNLPVVEASRIQVQSFLKELMFPCFCVVNPGASWASKRWNNQRFAEVARHVFQRYQIVPVVTWSGDEESQMASEIVEASMGAAVKCPPTSLTELAAIVAQADFFVGCDTGPLHLATAMGTPCIGLYGPTRPECSGAYGPQHLAVQAWYQDGSRRERRAAENKAMLAIETPMVQAAVDQMFAILLRQRSAG